MRYSALLVPLCAIAIPCAAQDLTLSIAGNAYKIQNDTVYIEKETGEAINFTIVYTISGTNRPVQLQIKDGAASTLLPSAIIAGMNTTKSLTSNNNTGRLQVALPAADNYSKYLYSELIFSWPDLLNPLSRKQKRFVLKIHKKKRFFDWVDDPTNTPKLEIIQYTDFLGISSDRPNGALQQQFLFKWPIVKSHFNLTKNVKLQFLRSILVPNILLNRIDKARDDSSMLVPLGRSIVTYPGSSEPDTVANVIGTFDMIRYANTIIEGSVNLVALQVDNSRIYFNLDYGLLRNRIKDTISQPHPVSRPVYSYLTGWHFYAKSLLDSKLNLNIELEFGRRRVRLQDNFFKQYDTYMYENGPVSGIRFPVRTPDARNISKPIYYASAELLKDWGEKSTNYAFLRFKYQWQRGSYRFVDKDQTTLLQEAQFSNHFFQVNLGISLGLEDLFKKK